MGIFPKMSWLLRALLAAATIAAAMPTARAATLDLTTATVADIRAAYGSGRVTVEQVFNAYLARIAAYDKQGPNIEAIVALNPKALDEARRLDRTAASARGPLHGIPVVIKDNIDVAGLATTAGSQLLDGNIAATDAPVVERLRRTGAVILAKVNMSEFAGSGGSVSGTPDLELLKAGAVPNGSSSLGLQTRNPHDPLHGPQGSSGGTGAALAAVFAPVGLGTDTGGSVRMPASGNGIAALKPTKGLLSRTGVVPLALTLDTVGPMARSVHDLAVTLGAMTGVEPKDATTTASDGKFSADYTAYLKRGSLKGARIGIARNVMGKSPDTDAVVEQAIATLRKLGAEVVDPAVVPLYLIDAKSQAYNMLVA
ncbi:MAG: glutamyl-tRNA amidotransferase, partial [Alphaproteobacteria bacterium]|nr:glutamyl-tRNA amidotransferase [Alphaproteobacteria bacterium]